MARGVRLSTARGTGRWWRRHAWWAIAATIGGAAAVVGLVVWQLPAAPSIELRLALDWQPGRVLAQPWRLLTAALVHLSPGHLLANLVGLAIIGALGREARCDARDALAWALAWPLTHLALLVQPSLQHYAGLSGVLHAGVAVAAWRLLHRHRGGPRAVGVLLLAGLAAKILWEAPWTAPVHRVPGWSIPIAPLAHATGTLAGLAMAVLLSLSPRRRSMDAAAG